MKKINKKLPISVLKEIKQFINSTRFTNTLFKIVETDEYLFRADDIDVTSDFHFFIESYHETHGYLINIKPVNQKTVENTRMYTNVEKVSSYFQAWHACLAAYAELEEEEKDPFLKNLEEQFLDGMDLNEENKDNLLTLKEIFLLEEHLSKIIEEIPNYENRDNLEQIQEIIEEATLLRGSVGKQTKEWVAKKLSSVLAKITKEGPHILKSIFKEAGKQIMTQGIKFLLEHGDKFIS